MSTRPLILITNDDGLFSPGLHAAATAVADLGDLLLVAPHEQQSATGRSWPTTPRTGVITETTLTIKERAVPAYSVVGSPAQAVAHAVWEIADRKPDLCISGINYGENLGLGLSVSGTVGAAFEADAHDIPALAVSLAAALETHFSQEYSLMDWAAAQHFTTLFTSHLLTNGLPDKVAVLNVNVPHGATPGTSIRQTKQSRHDYYLITDPVKRDFTQPHQFGIKLRDDVSGVEPDSDLMAVVFDRVVSATPLTWSLTASCDFELPDGVTPVQAATN